MYQKFIITADGVLRFGCVYQHRDLLRWGEECPYGGGLWMVDESRGAIMLYGRSFAFGAPCFEYVREIEWPKMVDAPCPLLYLPCWPSDRSVIPVLGHLCRAE
jgi:hypothetical protein